jgi:hypothetical protein
MQSPESRKQDRPLYERLYVAQEDLRQAASFAAHILKNGWHFHPWERRSTTYMKQSAFTTALVVSYARPFTKSRGWPKIPKRIAPYDQEQKTLHKRILALRNEIYAHSDVGKRNVRPFKILDRPSAIEMLPSMRLTKEETEMILRMIRLTNDAISIRLGQLIDAVLDKT